MQNVENILFYCPSMEALARKIADVDSTITLGNVKWGHFPDGFPDMFVHNVNAVRRSNVTLLADFTDPQYHRDQMWLMKKLRRLHPAKLQLALPYFPVGTMERSDSDGVVATASCMADDISDLGEVTLITYDLHALQIVYYFEKTVNVVLKSMAKMLKEELRRMDKPCLVFPDDGAYKRFGKMFDLPGTDTPEFPIVVCGKVRKGNDRVVTIKDGDPRGLNCMVYDDLTHTCKTVVRCTEALFEAGAATVSAAVTHGVMENGNWHVLENIGLTEVIFSDSCPSTVIETKGNKLFRTLSLAPSLARAIRA